MIIIKTKYCRGCQNYEEHLVIIQKADLQGYTFITRWICLSPYCNEAETIQMTYEQVQSLIGGKDEDKTSY